MFVPTCAVAVALILLSACGGSTESAVPAAPAPSADRLLGAWRRDYITAGALSLSSSLRFQSDGSFTMDTVSMTSLTEPAAVLHEEGTFHSTELGGVEYDSVAEGSRTERENSLTFVEGRALDHRCCAKRTETDVWWTHRGYLAKNAARTQFHREAAERQFEPSGTLKSVLRTYIDLTFSDPPLALAGRSDGTLEIALRIAVDSAQGVEVRDFFSTLPCRVQADGELLVVLLVGWDTTADGAVAEQPYRAPGLWSDFITQNVDTADWSERARAALLGAFEPYLAFDPARPDVLFHHIDWNTLAVTGYARVGD